MKNKSNNSPSKEPARIAQTTPYAQLRLCDGVDGREIGREIVDSPEDVRPAYTRLRSKRGKTTHLVLEIAPNLAKEFQFTSPISRNLAAEVVRSFLMEELAWRLSRSDYQDFRQHGLAAPDESRVRICSVIDDFILWAPFLCGPAIFLLPEVLQRLSDWLQTEAGIERYRVLGQRLALLPKVYRGMTFAPLQPWWVRSRGLAVRELRALRKRLQANPPHGDLLTAVCETTEHAGDFPILQRMGDAFVAFAASHSDSLKALLLDGRLTPKNFMDELGGWLTNYKPESFRQRVQMYLKSRRSPSRSSTV